MQSKERIYALENDQALRLLKSTAQGLDEQEAQLRLERFGPNQLPPPIKEPLFKRFLRLLADPMVLVLLAAAALSVLLGEWVDSAVIAVVVVINTILSLVQEGKAEKAVEALTALAAPTAVVRRSGRLRKIPAHELTLGDVVLLEAGDICPADMRLLSAFDLSADEASLTGESLPASKHCQPLPKAEKGLPTPIDAQRNMVFMGTPLLTGRGEGLVTAVGAATEIGRVAGLLAETKPRPTPLQNRLGELSKILSWAVLGISALVFVLMLTRGNTGLLDAFMLAVSLAVAAVPEGLAVVVTLVLSGGMREMSREKAVARTLSAVETLGSVQIVCSDKTGTLTENRMRVTRWQGNQALLAEVSALCSSIKCGRDGGLLGDPTEMALYLFADEKGINREQRLQQCPLLAELPFDSSRKMMSTLHQQGTSAVQYTKGAFEAVLACSSRYVDENGQIKKLDSSKRKAILAEAEDMAGEALRVLAAAYAPDRQQAEEKGLTFIGLLGLRDRPRPEAKLAVEQAKKAGIRTIMVSGDNIVTARVIARELGILEHDNQAVDGTTLAGWSDDELRRQLTTVRVFARVRPEDKLRIVQAWQKIGKVTAMTGDGINDAPALKAADIGVGMGRTGSEVSKRAADLVLTDDNFSSIISAVREGRRIYDNIRKAIQFLLASNLAEVIAIFIASLSGVHLFLPIHLLWINLVTDCLPAVALGREKAEDGIMQRPPRPPQASIFSDGLGGAVLRQGLVMALLTLASYAVGYAYSADIATTMAFFTLATAELFHSWNMRSRKHSIFTLSTSNRFLSLSVLLSFALNLLLVATPAGAIFSLSPLAPMQILYAVLLSFAIVPLTELGKLVGRSRRTGRKQRMVISRG